MISDYLLNLCDLIDSARAMLPDLYTAEQWKEIDSLRAKAFELGTRLTQEGAPIP